MKHKNLSKFFAITVCTLISSPAFANLVKERIVSEQTVESILELNKDTVRCSAIGYGQSELKVSVPDLQDIAFFNHANRGETLPCITAGPCKFAFRPEGPGFVPGDILKDDAPNATVQLHVILKEEFVLDEAHKICERTLKEDVSTSIRNIPFAHHREGFLGTFPYELCEKL
jgi:hypothetical protein